MIGPAGRHPLVVRRVRVLAGVDGRAVGELDRVQRPDLVLELGPVRVIGHLRVDLRFDRGARKNARAVTGGELSDDVVVAVVLGRRDAATGSRDVHLATVGVEVVDGGAGP